MRNVLSYAGREHPKRQKGGVAAEAVPRRSATCCGSWSIARGRAPAPALAAAQRARVAAGDRDAAHFAWYGPNTPERAFGYRVIGDAFVIEMGSVDGAAQHLHTIYHDLDDVLGRARVRCL